MDNHHYYAIADYPPPAYDDIAQRNSSVQIVSSENGPSVRFIVGRSTSRDENQITEEIQQESGNTDYEEIGVNQHSSEAPDIHTEDTDVDDLNYEVPSTSALNTSDSDHQSTPAPSPGTGVPDQSTRAPSTSTSTPEPSTSAPSPTTPRKVILVSTNKQYKKGKDRSSPSESPTLPDVDTNSYCSIQSEEETQHAEDFTNTYENPEREDYETVGNDNDGYETDSDDDTHF